VDIPGGSQANTVLRLKGKGSPLFGGRGKGHLLLRLAVPETLAGSPNRRFGE